MCRAVLAVFVSLLAVCFTSGLLLSVILLLMVLPVLLACVRAVITRAVSDDNDMTACVDTESWYREHSDCSNHPWLWAKCSLYANHYFKIT